MQQQEQGRLAAWHLPRGPVGPASRWTATSKVEIGQTTYPVNRRKVGRERKEGSGTGEEARDP